MKIHEGLLRTEGRRFAVVAARWNDFVVSQLLDGADGAVSTLRRSGATDDDIEIYRCPGAFEIPALVKRVIETARYDGIVCLGTVIRGDTPHFTLVVNECASFVARAAFESSVAIGFGVLACENIEQAMDRTGLKGSNRGGDAAAVAIQMAQLFSQMKIT